MQPTPKPTRDRIIQNAGPTSETVREHAKRMRKSRGWSLAAVCERMTEAGRPFAISSLSEIENGKRRVDVDDLIALAAALGVSPLWMLMPDASAKDEPIAVTGVGAMDANRYWEWLRAENPLPGSRDHAEHTRFMLDNQPGFITGPYFAALDLMMAELEAKRATDGNH